MRKLKFIIRILIIAFLINILIYFSFTIHGYNIIYNAVKNMLSYNINVYDEDFDEFDSFEKSFKKPSIYFFEDSPGLSINYDIFINNLNYMIKTNNIKYIVTELSYSEALWINYFMDNENFTDLIKPIINSYGTSYLNSNEFINLLNFVRDHNALFDSNKIEIIGINPEKSINIAADYIDYLFEQFVNKRKPDTINQAINFIADDDLDYYQNMYNSLLSNERIYREYFVDKFFSFNFVLKNIINTQSDRHIHNFIDIYNSNIRAKYYIQLPDNMKFYEMITQEHPHLRDEIVYTKLFYDSEQFMNDTTQNVYLLNNKIFKYFEKHRNFVYKLNKKHYEPYDTEYGDTYFILTNPHPITSYTNGEY